jgi:ABC-type transporter Mla subunit MlaD
MPRVADRRRALGVLVVLGALAAVFLAVQRPDPFSGDRTVRALFADAAGIAPVGAEVRMAGTAVGRITGRERQGDAALVTMTVQDEAGALHRDATAELRPRLMFEGTAYVELTAGSPGEPLLGDATLPLANTRVAVSLADTFDLLGPAPAQALHADARELRRTLSPAARASLRGTLALAPGLLRDAADTSEAALGPHGNDLAEAVRGAARVAGAVAERRDDLVPLAASAARTAAAPEAGPLAAAIDRLPAAVAGLRDGGRSLATTVQRLHTLADAAVPGARRLAPTLQTVRPLLREALPVVHAARPFVADADAALRWARTAAGPAEGAIDAVTPALAVLTGGLLSALERKTSLGTPAYIAFMGLFAGGGGASRPFSDDGRLSGHFMRFGFRFLSGAGSPAPPCTLLESASAPLADAVNAIGGCQR